MIFKARKTYWYTPDIEENLKQPEGKRLKARIDRPDRETREDLTVTEVVRDYSKHDVAEARDAKVRRPAPSSADEPRKTSMTFRRRQDTGRILRDHVPELVNCDVETVGENGKFVVEHITTGAQLAACTAYGIDRLVDMICTEVLRDELPEELSKNFEPASSSS